MRVQPNATVYQYKQTSINRAFFISIIRHVLFPRTINYSLLQEGEISQPYEASHQCKNRVYDWHYLREPDSSVGMVTRLRDVLSGHSGLISCCGGAIILVVAVSRHNLGSTQLTVH